MKPPTASLQVLDHRLCDEPANIDPLVALHPERRSPQGISDVAGEILVSVPLLVHAMV